MKRYLYLFLVALTVVFSHQFAFAEAQGKLLRVGYVNMSNLPYLDPVRSSSSTDRYIASALYETLVVLGDDGVSIRPGVAESWEVSDDGLIYTFHLREDARWSNGDPVVAGDFVEGWFRAAMPDTHADFAALHQVIAGVEEMRIARTKGLDQQQDGVGLDQALERWKHFRSRYEKQSVSAPDKNTLVVRLREPVPYLLYILTNPVFSPMYGRVLAGEVELVMHEGAVYVDLGHFYDPKNAVYNGPYRLHEFREDEIRLVMNEHYWARDSVGFSRCKLLLFESAEQAVESFKRGAIDWAVHVSTSNEAVQMFKDNDPAVQVTAFASVYYYEFNTRDEVDGRPNPFADPALRRALAHLFDREAMVEAAAPYLTSLKTFIPPGTIPGYTPPHDAAANHDVQKAKRLLAAAGYKDLSGIGPVTLLINSEANHRAIAQPLIEALTALGADVRVSAPQFPVYLDRAQKGEFHLRRAGWFGDYHDPTTFLGMFGPQWTEQYSGYADKAYYKLLDQARVELDTAKRMDILQQAEAKLLSDAVVVPCYRYGGISLYDPQRLGEVEHPWGAVRLDRVQKIKEKTPR